MYYIYVIQNPGGKIYIGQTADLRIRLDYHNGLLPSKSNSFTKINKGPWKLIYQEEFKTRKQAMDREKFLKSHHGRDYFRSKLGR